MISISHILISEGRSEERPFFCPKYYFYLVLINIIFLFNFEKKIMATKSGSIVLGTIRYFQDVVPQGGSFTVQMLSTNLSAATTWNLQFSLDGTNWDNAQEAATDISDSLVDDAVMIKSFEADPGVKWKILFAGVTTGTVSYIINPRYAN